MVGISLPWRWSPSPGLRLRPRLSLAGGFLEQRDRRHSFFSIGPSFELSSTRHRGFFDFGVSPTLIGRSTYGDERLGGSFQFTSHFAFGLHVGARDNHSIALRWQHLSNAGLSGDNPGLNLLMLDYRFRLPRRNSHGASHALNERRISSRVRALLDSGG